MTLAWFTPASGEPGALDDLAHVRAALATAHRIDVVHEADAHDFVWRHARAPYDLVVYELADTPAHHYLWAYLLTHPGVVALRAGSLHASRTLGLLHRGRRAAYDAEMVFNEGPRRGVVPWHVALGRWPLVRIPALAARMVIVGDEANAAELPRRVPEACVRYAPIGVRPPVEPPAVTGVGERRPLVVAAVDRGSHDVLAGAAARARRAGAAVELVGERELITDIDVRAAYGSADVVVALGRPAFPTGIARALAGMAASRCVIVPETAETAEWPALDPQSWSVRGYGRSPAPVVVSIDPRDEEHSLALALVRLAADASLRQRLAADGHAWWRAAATPEHAATVWNGLLREAASLDAPAKPPDWPAHLTDDGSGLARRILADVGLAAEWL